MATESTNLLELRADGGHQTVLPGSLHQDTGELIEWASVPFPDVPQIDVAQLEKAVKKVAIASLLARHMWVDGQRNEMTKHLAGILFYLEWPQEEVEQLVEALDDYADSHDKTHRLTVTSTYKKGERGGKIVGATSLRKLVDDRLVDRLLSWAGSPDMDFLQEYNERFTAVMVGSTFRIADSDVPDGDLPTFLAKSDFFDLMGVDYATIEDKRVPKAKLWLANPRRRSCGRVDFIPGMDDTPGTFNLWTGWATQPKTGDCSGWLELVTDYVCGKDAQLAHWVLNWFANILHEPRAKSGTALVLIGQPGAGKSLLFDYFGVILGQRAYTPISHEDQIYGRFNKHLASTLLLHSAEALHSGDLRHRGTIKSLITDEFRIFEQKNVDAITVRNYIRLALTSNYFNAAPVEAGDRRFTVIDLEERKIPEALVQKVLAEKHGDGPAALHQFLLDFSYDKELCRINFKNAALGVLKGVTSAPVESWWHETLASGYLLPDYLAWATRPEKAAWPMVVGGPALYLSMVQRLRDKNVRQIPNEGVFAAQLQKFVGTKLRRKQVWYSNPQNEDAPQAARNLSDRQYSVYNLPDLTACRSAFEVYLGQTIEWPEEADEDDGPAHEKY